MKFLLPLGLLGLLGIVVLIIIYIIKPNFQQKLISSTYIWKLSLKYQKKRLPISQLRNILLIICQVLAILTATAILTRPVEVLREKVEEPEVILVLDSSASMRTGDEGNTRFENAVRAVQGKAEETFERGGIVSVILADNAPDYYIERAGAQNREEVADKLDALINGGDDLLCSYGSTTINDAVTLSSDVLQMNPSARVFIYSDQQFDYMPEGITVTNFAESDEWNAAILDAQAIIEENYYTFIVDVACYGRDYDLSVNLEVFGKNAKDATEIVSDTVSLGATIPCTRDMPARVIFKYFSDDVTQDELIEYENNLPENTHLVRIERADRAYSYQSVHVYLDEEDSLTLDNSFDIYGGLKEVIKVQYYSAGTDPSDSSKQLSANIFFAEALAALQKEYVNRWDFQITQVKQGNDPALEGFDFYIFEHAMPEKLPTDGVVFLVDPLSNVPDSGFTVSRFEDFQKRGVYLAPENAHPILNNVDPTKIFVSRYQKLSQYDPAYIPLFSYAGDPLLLAKNEGDSRVVAMLFSVHYSNFPLLIDFPIMLYNMFEYYLPSTVVGNGFETYEKVVLQSRGESLNVSGYLVDETITTFPSNLTLSTPGPYKLTQTTFSGKQVEETIYVSVPAAESNIFAVGAPIQSPYFAENEADYFRDLLLYLAIALVSLLTIEWYLQHKQNSI